MRCCWRSLTQPLMKWGKANNQNRVPGAVVVPCFRFTALSYAIPLALHGRTSAIASVGSRPVQQAHLLWAGAVLRPPPPHEMTVISWGGGANTCFYHMLQNDKIPGVANMGGGRIPPKCYANAKHTRDTRDFAIFRLSNGERVLLLWRTHNLGDHFAPPPTLALYGFFGSCLWFVSVFLRIFIFPFLSSSVLKPGHMALCLLFWVLSYS